MRERYCLPFEALLLLPGFITPSDEGGPQDALGKLPRAPAQVEGEVCLGSLLGGVCTGKIKLRTNTWRDFQMPLLAAAANVKAI